MKNETINNSSEVKAFNEDVSSLIKYLKTTYEDGWFSTLNIDLLTCAFQELVGSEWFSTMDAERRKSLFTQYQSLSFTLDKLENFCSKHQD